MIPTNINVIPTSNNNNQNQFQPSVLQPQTEISTEHPVTISVESSKG